MFAMKVPALDQLKQPQSASLAATTTATNINTASSLSSSIQQHEDYDYESLPNGYNFHVHMLAGAIAGIMEHSVMYPVDSVKTRMQSLYPGGGVVYRTVPGALYKIIKNEGFKRPFRGISLMVGGAGPAHALYFSCYEKMKRVFSGTETGGRSPLAQAGSLATILHDAVMNPVEVVKQRLQMYNSQHNRVVTCASSILKNEGLKAFYRSYTTQLIMNIPFHCSHLVTYEFFQELTNPERKYNPMTHITSGAIAGAFAGAITTPLDVCKTLINTQDKMALKATRQLQITGLVNAVVTIYRCCGFKGYFNGLQARVLYSAPSTAISWSVYEFFKKSLRDEAS
ncbi:mitoferrin-1-like isoform X2 [Brevipalpus obovatus]|uniref:mitoferrin-1-like isoform X2 n=1 Tax=Brevipalpus obovatus TaxID=246614 RepID=UPI003D9F1A57